MLTSKEVQSLPKGYFGNLALRRAFGKKHGHVVPARVTIDGTEVDKEFCGNRSQWKFRKRHPYKPLPEKQKPIYQSNRIEEKKKIGLITKVMQFIQKLFSK